MDQPGKVANPARGQLNRENNIPLSPCVPENLVQSSESLQMSKVGAWYYYTSTIINIYIEPIYIYIFFFFNQNAPRPSEHPPVFVVLDYILIFIQYFIIYSAIRHEELLRRNFNNLVKGPIIWYDCLV